MKINDKNGLGNIEVKTLKLPEFVKKPFATYLFTGQTLIFFQKEGDPKSEDFIRMATLNDDGSDFKEIFSGVIKRVGTSNGIRHMPFTDNKRVLLGDYILECEPSIKDCKKTSIVPVRYPWGIASDSKFWMHWSEIIVAPDNEHMAWTSLLKTGGCTVVVGKLVREKDEYVITRTQVINPSSSFIEDESRQGYIIPQPSRGGEVKQFVRGGTAISAVGAGRATTLPDSIVQDLLSDNSVQITKLPSYEETAMFSPDEKLGLVMSTRFSLKTNCAILGLVPRPHVNLLMSSIYQTIYLYSVAGPRFYRKGNVGPVLVEIDRSVNEQGYLGVALNDPKEEWIYHSPISWHPEGKKAMWQEQMRGGSQPRIRIVELLDYIPKESVHTQSTPDNIPYAKSEPDEADGQYEFLKSGKIAGKVSGYIDYCSSRSLPEKGIISQSQSLYVNYSDEDNAVYNGYEKTEVLKEGNVIYEADLKLTGIKSGEMKMRLHFTAGKYENPPKLSFEKDENGKPMSYGYAEYDSWRLNVKDMSE